MKYYSINEFFKEKSVQQELVEDLVQTITVFGCRLQRRRVDKTRNL